MAERPAPATLLKQARTFSRRSSHAVLGGAVPALNWMPRVVAEVTTRRRGAVLAGWAEVGWLGGR